MAQDRNQGSEAPRSSTARSIARALGWIGIGLVSFLLACVLLLATVGDRVLSAYIEREVQGLSEELGRPVHVERVEVSALEGRVHLSDFRLGAAAHEPGDTPVVAFRDAVVDIGMWRTLASLGFRPYVEELSARDLTLAVVKLPDGTLNLQHLTPQGPAAKPATPPSRGSQERMRNAKVGRVSLENAAIYFLEGTQRKAQITRIELNVRDLGYRSGMKLELAAAALQAQRNVTLRARLGEARRDGTMPALDDLQLQVTPTELAPLAPFLVALGAGYDVLQQGVLSAQAAAATPKAKHETHANCQVQLRQAQFPGGEVFTADLQLRASVSHDGRRLDLQEGVISAGDMSLTARGELQRSQRALRLLGLNIQSHGLNFESMRRLYPRLDQQLAPLELSGKFGLTVAGGGDADAQKASVELQFTETHMKLADKLDKPAGMPMRVHADLTSKQASVSLHPLTLELADYALVAQGRVEHLDREAPSFDLQLDTPERQINGLIRVLPPVARALSRQKIPGTLHIHGTLKGTSRQYTADAAVELASLQVNVPGARLEGGGRAQLRVRERGTSTHASMRMDFTNLAANYADVLNKPKGTPFRGDVSFDGRPKRSDIAFDARLSSLVAQGTARLEGAQNAQTFTAQAKVPSFDVQTFAALLPGDTASQLGDIRFSGEIRAKGATHKLQTFTLSIPSFTARAGRSDLHGSLELKNLQQPQVALAAQSNYLDVEEFLPSPEAHAQPQARRDAKQAPPSALAKTSGSVDVTAKAGRVADVAFEDLRAKLKLRNGRASAQVFEVSAFGGAFDGSGTEFPLATGSGEYHLKGRANAVEAADLLERFARTAELLKGSLSASMDLKAVDLTPEGLRESLTGKLSARMDEGVFVPVHGYAALADKLGNAIPGLEHALGDAKAQARVEQGWKLRDLAGSIRFDEGSARIDEPLTAKTPEGELSVTGQLGLATSSDLHGTFTLTSQAASKLAGGKAKFDKPLPIAFEVKGPLTHPQLAFPDVGKLAEPIARAYLQGESGKKLQRELNQLLGGLAAPSSDETKRALEAKKRRAKQSKQAQQGK